MSCKANVIQIVGYRNSGKTTLVCHLVSKLAKAGFRVGTIKHDAHRFDIDHPGRDTWKHRMAGAETVAITSTEKTAIVRHRHTPLDELLCEMGDLDLVLVEGFKFADYPKIVLIRTEEHLPLLQHTENIIAVVSSIPIQETVAPVFAKDDFSGIDTHVLKYVKEEG